MRNPGARLASLLGGSPRKHRGAMGVIEEIGIANKSLTTTTRQKRRFLTSFRPFL